MSRFDALHSAANEARFVLERVAGVLEGVADGSWDEEFTLTPEGVEDLCAALSNLAELAKATRAAIGEGAGGTSDAMESVATRTFRANADGVMTGEEIISGWRAGSVNVEFIGRRGGLEGRDFQNDAESGEWRVREYQVRALPISAANWFPVAGFVKAIS